MLMFADAFQSVAAHDRSDEEGCLHFVLHEVARCVFATQVSTEAVRRGRHSDGGNILVKVRQFV